MEVRIPANQGRLADGRERGMRYRVWQNGRIVFYQRTAGSDFWEPFWAECITRGYYRRSEEGDLAEYSYLADYLRRTDRILEAGCGTGRYVVALRAKGFSNTEGIDCGEHTIGMVKAVFPDLPVRLGDAMKVDVPDGHYDAYISIGVVEHREDGPEPFLTEAHRILRPGGYAFISVPYINVLRRLKTRLGFYRGAGAAGGVFYQYAFSEPEFRGVLERAGFDVLKWHGISGAYGIRDELHGLFRFLGRLPGGWRLGHCLKRFDRLDDWGHMILFICRKRAGQRG